MRLVIDCNIVISASLTPNGVAAQALRKAETFHTLLASAATIEEFSSRILKPKFDRYFSPIDIRLEAISRYTNLIEWVVPVHKLSVCRDLKDDKYLELALSGNADGMVTGDSDLVILNPFQSIPIISPKEFLEKF